MKCINLTAARSRVGIFARSFCDVYPSELFGDSRMDAYCAHQSVYGQIAPEKQPYLVF